MKATRAIEMLTAARIPHEVRTYESDGFTPATEAAAKLSIPFSAMFKTLIVRGERRGIVMALVPGDGTLSLRKLAHEMGDKRVEMVDISEITRLTGFVRGGVSPLGGKRSYPIFLDRTSLQHPQIAVSAGIRGLVLMLAPGDLAQVTRATVADLLE
jgi:Cys-tRNA(Pro)/Cys-tRNA(Cys) deacylase